SGKKVASKREIRDIFHNRFLPAAPESLYLIVRTSPMAPTNGPKSDRLSEVEVLAYLSHHRHAIALRQIAEALDLTHAGRRDLKKIIEHLAQTGAIEESGSGNYRLRRDKPAPRESDTSGPQQGFPRAAGEQQSLGRAGRTGSPGPAEGPPSAARPAARLASDPNRVTGRMVMHRDGYGFLVPDHPVSGVEGDLYVGRNNTGDAMHGDRVAARIERRKPGGRAEAAVTRIVERAHPTVVGIFQYGATGNTVRPFDERLQQEILIPPGDELTEELRARAAGGSGQRRIAPAAAVERAERRGGERGANAISTRRGARCRPRGGDPGTHG